MLLLVSPTRIRVAHAVLAQRALVRTRTHSQETAFPLARQSKRHCWYKLYGDCVVLPLISQRATPPPRPTPKPNTFLVQIVREMRCIAIDFAALSQVGICNGSSKESVLRKAMDCELEILVTSYETLRAASELFAKVNWRCGDFEALSFTCDGARGPERALVACAVCRAETRRAFFSRKSTWVR